MFNEVFMSVHTCMFVHMCMLLCTRMGVHAHLCVHVYVQWILQRTYSALC